MSFFDTEEAHAVMLAYAADGGGLPWSDDTGISSWIPPSWVCVALSKILSSQVWARGVLL
jgi:hypothetical protein